MEIKKESRIFGIKGFRNIGFSEKGETEERLILNYSLNKEYMGKLGHEIWTKIQISCFLL